MGSGWQEPNDDGRGKAVLAVAVIVATLVIGIVVDVALGRNGAQESAPVESQETETVSEPARGETSPGEDAQEDDSGDGEVADSTRLSGITFTHASRLSGLSGTTRTSLARALAMWAASEGVSLDEADVTDDATEDQQGAKASLEAGGKSLELTYDGTAWTVYDGTSYVTISTTESEGAPSAAAAPAPVAIDDADALARLVGTDAAGKLPGAWSDFAAANGIDAAGATVTGGYPTPDATQILFTVTDSSGTAHQGTYATGSGEISITDAAQEGE